MKAHTKPHVFVNVAVSLDGRISDWSRKQVKISCEEDFKRVDRLRAESDAIVVGVGTVLADNPSLKIKSEELKRRRIECGKEENPLRVVLDSRARTPLNFKVVDGTAKTLVAVSDVADKEKLEALSRKKGVEVAILGENRVNITKLLSYLSNKGVRSVMVEGGAKVIASFLKAKAVDKMIVYHGGVIFGEGVAVVEGKFDPHLKLKLVDVKKVGRGFISEWVPEYSDFTY